MFADHRPKKWGGARRFGPGRQGMALVVILASLVLLSIILAAFLTQATLSRQISFSSAGQFRAESVAYCGLDTIVGDLRSEIAAGSTPVSVVENIALYRPLTNLTAVPSRVADQGLANLVKVSRAGSNFWKPGAPYGTSPTAPARASTNSSTNVSANGRFVSLKRWNAPLLLTNTFSNTFLPPDWILVTRRGPVENGAALTDLKVMADSKPDNLDYVVGRFAYTIYNEGGLLDVTVAGFPDGMPPDFSAKRGLLPQVDLGKIPGITNADAIVQWRNKVSAASPAAYTNWVFGNTNGFGVIAPGDQTFVSRQDLIRYAQAHSNQISPDALQFLGTFSRELNGPSFSPAASRPRTLANEGYRKSIGTEQDDVFNPSLIETRVTEEFVRTSDGTTAKVGEPLIKNRFPLNRLRWLTPDGPATAADAPRIEKEFGLTWNATDKSWTYRGGASSIKRLADVANEGREPDFLELLQAGITIGSLGKMASDGSEEDGTSNVAARDGNTFYQIMQIGANLIDQYDEDSLPTQLMFGAGVFSGIEDLPYLTRVVEMGYRYPNPATPGLHSHQVGLWYQPEVWNPHAPNGAPSAVPSRFRYIVTGTACGRVAGGGPVHRGTAGAKLSAPNGFPSPTGIEFSGDTVDLRLPTFLAPEMGAVAAGAKDNLTADGVAYVGIWVGDVNAPDRWYHNLVSEGFYDTGQIEPAPYVTHELQYWDGAGWITYDRIQNVAQGVRFHTRTQFDKFFLLPIRKSHAIRSDPRSDRFGVGSSDIGPPVPPETPLHQTARPDAGLGFSAWDWGTAPGWNVSMYNGSRLVYSGLFSENKNPLTRYNDPDGTLRMADGAYTTGTLPNGYPLASGNFPSRPLVLNRPFRSVADMGYASRGMPWKHLDFFTTDSGDAVLLDLFCLNEHTGPQSLFGRLDPNTRQKPVLEAVFSGALQVEDNGAVLSDGDAGSLADGLMGLTGGSAADQGPLQNRAELVTRWLGNPAILPGNSAATIIKRQREAGIRALGDIANTRTWNLLIDIIAQSGRYVAASGKFTVEGERRYWLHLALDRYTGQVVSQYLEPVYE